MFRGLLHRRAVCALTASLAFLATGLPHAAAETAAPEAGGATALLPPVGKITITTTAPERVWISDRYELTVLITNGDPFPHLVSIDVQPDFSDVCSVASYSTSSSATQTRPNEYLVAGSGQTLLGGLEQGLFGGDSVDAGATIRPTLTGTCRILVLVTVDLLWSFSAQQDTVVETPPKFANLGSVAVVASDCGTAQARPGADATVLTVAADEPVDVVAAFEYTEPCSDDDAIGTLLLQREEADGSWKTVGASSMTNTGHADLRAKEKMTLSPGNHRFRLVASASTGFRLSIECLTAILAALAALPELLAALGVTSDVIVALVAGFGLSVPLVTAVAAVALVVLVAITIGHFCFGLLDQEIFTYTVSAVSGNPTDAHADLGVVTKALEALRLHP